ncbi:DUF397 domain-containing protein [Streptomyces sp. NPDC093261]|uniref:DUF397 domain-containing protein n=1 Tax=Streptomyces sp. NPDC093261 TaxID=3366037 RepID=UPI003824F351
MMRHDLPEAGWFKSSYSGNGGGQCVEAQRVGTAHVAVRDSKTKGTGAFVFTTDAFTSFVDFAKTFEV